MTVEAALELDGASFSFGSRRFALSDVSFSVGQGEIVGLVGPNGSGKSTLVRLIFDLLQLAAGEIRIAGAPHTQATARRSAIYLPSDGNLPDFLSGSEYVELVRKLYGQDRPRLSYLAEAFTAQGMPGREHDLIEGYSHGMRRKLQLLTAESLERPLTVIDETFNGIDLDALREAKLAMREGREHGRSYLVCTHDFSLLEDVADRVILLRGGAVLDEVNMAAADANGERLSAIADEAFFGGVDQP